ncbi:MAG: TonB-dependent receptor plug domain-containing protein [Pseudohongiella sp.]|nr:TonB-dependent receptor plug domain-containing protein [Pseudohongiella sp.]MDO9522062.1 TonB-dependent receptor plug domain-containing protein [Pseudohongiella sp.]MDP2128697.1 TonB-dependent receptor plug domain-containing protein [Pseudohongiella sp.]
MNRFSLAAAVRRSLLLAPVLSISILSAPSLIHAQEAVDNSSNIVYPASYFEQWAPVTAQDMLNRIPGLSATMGGNFGSSNNSRGLGGGGGNQILINGKRVAGKANEANSQLARISASKVERIDLIRGTSTDLDVRGDQIVNIVLTEALTSQSYSYEINTDRYADGHVQPGGKFAVNGLLNGLSYVLSAEMEPRHDYRPSFESSVLGDFSANDTISEDRTRDQYTNTIAANLGYELTLNSSARLNMLYSNFDNDVVVNRNITNLRTNPVSTRREREENPGRNSNWEIGGDYELRLDNSHVIKTLFIVNERDENTTRERFAVAADGTRNKDLFLNSDSVYSEKIIRGSYSMPLLSGQGVEIGAERAQTTLDSALRLGLPGAGAGSPNHGGLTPQTVSNANSTVEEIRVEPFVVHNWQISPRMSLESSLIYEASEITQTGDVFNKRDFSFVKPSFDWRFDVRQGLQLRGTATKSVRQLSFSDFVASSDDRDNDAATMAGNANLRQEQVWNFNIGSEYRLPNDAGVIEASVFYMEHTDVIERVDVTRQGGRPTSANGNIGDGNMYGFNGSASVRLGMIGVPSVMLISRLEIKTSEITDPFLGIDRRFQNYERGRFQLGFRHDLNRYRVTYGMNWNNRYDGNIKRYDIDNIERTSGEPNVTAYLEYITPQNIRIRFDARNATNNNQCRERTRYDGRLTSGVITEIESYCFDAARVVSIKINGTF